MAREILPGRRYCENFPLWLDGREHQISLGFYLDGRVAEVFIESARVGTPYNLLMKEAAIALSFALQHGCTVETMRSAMPRTSEGAPEGLLGVLLDRVVEMMPTAHGGRREVGVSV